MRRVSILLALVALTAGPALAQEGAPPRPTTVISQPKPQVVVTPKTAAAASSSGDAYASAQTTGDSVDAKA